MREIVLDTETTGLDPLAGHRIIEIGCLELFNHVPTSRVYHRYINPETDVSAESTAITGLTNQFLDKHPTFAEIAGDLMEFFGDAQFVIHNADFDIRFLNAEFGRLGFPCFAPERALCTLKLTRKRYPGAPGSLDALCQRFKVDNSGRALHGALLDAQLLAEVYVELLGGRQSALSFTADAEAELSSLQAAGVVMRIPRMHQATPEELAAHAGLLEKIRNPLWLAGDAA